MRNTGRTRLSPDDWARAALQAIARGGVDAVAVEPIASELGTTKGSFYWHFKNRDALIEAALDEWEKRLTEDLIQQLELEADPALRLRKLFMTAFELGPTDRAAEIALLSKPDHPAVVARVRRVAQRRITFVCSQLEELGWDSTQALDRAVLISYLYVGYLQARHVLPDAVSVNDRRRQVQLLFETLVAADLSAGWVDPVPMRS